MDLLSIVTKVGAGIAGPIVDYFNNRAKEKARQEELKHELHVKKLEEIRAGKIAEHEWDLKSIDNSGWRDEFLTIIISIPLVLVFTTQGAQQHILEAFTVLEKTPEWYRWMVGAMVASAFGIRQISQIVRSKKP